jgi:hypothetical protein
MVCNIYIYKSHLNLVTQKTNWLRRSQSTIWITRYVSSDFMGSPVEVDLVHSTVFRHFHIPAKYLLKSLLHLSVDTRGTTQEELNRFSWNVIFWEFYLNLLTHSNFGSNETTTGTLHEDLYAFLCTKEIGQGISRLLWLPCLFWLPWLKVKDQILINKPELLHCVYIS